MPKYIESTQTFVNPYNFISLGNKPPERAERKKGKFYGWIECNIETLTPLFIPDTSNDDVAKKRDTQGNIIKSYNFFSYNNKPVIPGSELRGILRSEFEALTNSCLSNIDDKKILYQRLPVVGTPGRIRYKNGQWKLIKCKRYGLHKSKCRDLKENQRIYFNNNDTKPYRKNIHGNTIKIFDEIMNFSLSNNSSKMGYFHKGEPFGNRKHHESVFVETQESFSILEDHVKNIINNIKIYREDNPQRDSRHKQYKDLPTDINKIKETGMLVYYNKIGNNYYLSPAAIGRYVFYKNLKNITGKHAPCDNKGSLCPACSLFGTTHDDWAFNGRLRITDGIVQGDYHYGEFVALKELSSPKLSATEFYLEKPNNAHIWNYDFKVKDWNSHQMFLYEAKIRGRKFYWHHKNPSNYIEQNPTIRNTYVKPLKPTAQFKFKVYLDGVSREELDKLTWILHKNSDGKTAHKLGFAKPIGFGSVKITINKIIERELKIENNKINYQLKDISPQIKDNLFPDNNIVEEYLKIMNFDEAPNNIKYPVNENDDKTYEWFVANRTIKGRGTKPKVSQVLKKILDNDVSLKKYKKQQNRRY